ncbi:MAG: tyrosine--tRNA ligase [Deltaproteobacteria bacterium]|nr:tyrosine--tRNA ligase [Deltaproteobacteria bacterium]
MFDTLEARGFVSAVTSPELRDLLAKERFTVYCGFDPTADSLHLGHLVPVVALSHFQRAGHRVLVVVGGATGMIGDPSGRSSERNLLSRDEIERNKAAVKRQMQRLIDFEGDNPALLLDNNDWIGAMSFVDWLRDVGKHFPLSYMLAKESVRSRLESESGLSYTEFSYMTLQAYDFLHLSDAHGCGLQVGGNDQWGNITAGMDLIRKVRGKSAHGLCFPLVTTSSGEKFGKSAGNAIWLDPARTTPWDFYQYLVRQDDRDVVRLLKLYTFLPLDRIAELAGQVDSDPERREAQRALALEVTRLLHGEDVAREVSRAAEVVYYSEIKDLSDETLSSVFADVPSVVVARPELEAGIDLVDLLVRASLSSSRGEAKRLLQSGGVYVNNVRADLGARVSSAHLASPSFLVLRAGKKRQCLVRVA